MKKISAEIVADSIDSRGNRITSFLLTYPRFIHGEIMTHRMFSRNSASSRAIPFNKMVKMVEEDPFIPIAWQKHHKGMQGTEYFTSDVDIKSCRKQWLDARDDAVLHSSFMYHDGTTKQLVNRLLEPFMWHTILVTATEYDNFFELRCPKYQTPVSRTIETQYSWKDLIENHSNPINLDILEENQDNWVFKMQHSLSGAEIHIQALAESMWDAMNESTPKELKPGEWHIPFGDKMNTSTEDSDSLWQAFKNLRKSGEYEYSSIPTEVLVATARCARLSYMTFDGEIDYEKDIKLHDTLLESGHMSPFEHCCRVMTNEEYSQYTKSYPRKIAKMDMHGDPSRYPEPEEGWCNNFRGFIPYRYLVENN
jgi:hypothetical protein